MRMKAFALAVCVFAAFALSNSCDTRKGEVGTRSNPIRFFFMPLKSSEVFATNSAALENYIQNTTGLVVKSVNSPDFLTIINAFANNQADAGFMNTLGFLMARDMAKAEAHLLALYGDVYRSYRGEILARVDGPVVTPTDLAGKTIAFADPFSASGYLYALKFLNDHNIKPAKTLFAGSHKKAVEMVYKGEADAAATYHTRPSALGVERDARAELAAEHPDIISKIKIVALTDEIPNGPIAFRRDLPVDVKSKLAGALVEFARTAEGRQTLLNLYNMTGLAIANDTDYNGVQDVIKKLGKTVEETVPGGISFYNTKILGPLLAN